MCGISGVIALHGDVTRDDVAASAAMVLALRHRGPDADGCWNDDRVAFSHRRLSILDVTEAGAQPMASHSGRLIVTFNGEIYNFLDLRRELRDAGWNHSSNSDTEVLLGAIERWGIDGFLERADGMFAFALYDRAARRVSLVRDRFGEKPLAYATHGDRLYLASELRSFAEIPDFPLALDAAATEDFFRFGYVPGEATIYRGVRRVAPATVAEIELDTGSVRERSYWSVPEWHDGSAGIDVPDLHNFLSTSVRNRLVSDRPLGVLLSGGVDSSLVAALAAAEVSGPLRTFTMGWDEAEYDESAQAAKVAAALGADHHDVRLRRADVVSAAKSLGGVMDEPFADPSQLGVLMVARAAREEVVVALAGDGGDELFAGYNRHRWLLRTQSFTSWPAAARRGVGAVGGRAAPVLEALLRPLPTTVRPRHVAEKMRKLAAALEAGSVEEAYQAVLAHNATVGTPRHLSDAVVRALGSDDNDEVLWGIRVADLNGYLVDSVLTKVDRATMSTSLESRTPFLNVEVARLALGLRHDQLIGAAGGKQPLRILLADLLPGIDFTQPKTGFGVPVESMMRNELREALAAAVTAYETRSGPASDAWRGVHETFVGGDDSGANLLWSLLMFETWADRAPHSITWA